ncbi:hypothetical protein [Haloglomus salinum]|uniref:hypothetical protein n=1 Tax=Haloglomus salinum TaxID=2962673 RepID=UPI0020C9A052|nr:hypothetical protein [Haloglomus salinum]
MQFAGTGGVGGLVIALVVPFLLVAFGSYVGVLMALQSFFGAESFAEAVESVENESVTEE